jgi:3-hydroxyisobutyrate dehydrogenase
MSGGLTIFVAGESEDVVMVTPALETLGTLLSSGSQVGDGQSFKMVNQLLAASHLAIAGEAIAFARALGLDPQEVLTAVTRGAGTSWMLEDRGPRMFLAAERRPVQTRLSILAKDVGLVLSAAEEASFDARILAAVATEYERACADGLDVADDSSIGDIDRTLHSVPPQM